MLTLRSPHGGSALCIVHPIPSRPAAALPGPAFLRPDLPARSRSGFASAKAGRSRLQGGSVGMRENGQRNWRNSKRPKIQWLRRCLGNLRNPAKFTPSSARRATGFPSSIRPYATAPWIVGRLPGHRYDLSRKPRKLWKPPPTMTAVHALALDAPRRGTRSSAHQNPWDERQGPISGRRPSARGAVPPASSRPAARSASVPCPFAPGRSLP